MFEKYFERPVAAQYLTEQRGLRTTANTLQKLASVGGGPVYQRFGKRAVYTQEALDKWANSKLSAPLRSTADAHVACSLAVRTPHEAALTEGDDEHEHDAHDEQHLRQKRPRIAEAPGNRRTRRKQPDTIT
jgi:hypothetical protein